MKKVDCLAHCPDADYFNDDWAATVLDIWIEARRAFVAEKLSGEVFRDIVLNGIIEAADWREQYAQAYQEAGLDPEDDRFESDYQAYVDANRQDALRLVPFGLYAELRWIPEWTFGGLDEVMETHGVRTSQYRSTYLEVLQPGEWLNRFLRLVNVSTESLANEAAKLSGADGEFADRLRASGFVVEQREGPSLMTPAQVIAALENSYSHAVPVVHAEIEVRALLTLDPSKPMSWTTRSKGEVHVGFHCFVNGAGYMDTYPGEVTIPPEETGFSSRNRWAYGIDKTYGLYRPAFYTTPIEA